jgi:hypothetical protein
MTTLLPWAALERAGQGACAPLGLSNATSDRKWEIRACDLLFFETLLRGRADPWPAQLSETREKAREQDAFSRASVYSPPWIDRVKKRAGTVLYSAAASHMESNRSQVRVRTLQATLAKGGGAVDQAASPVN